MSRKALVTTALLLGALLAAPSPARAEDNPFPELLREGNRPFWGSLSVGPAFNMWNYGTQLKITGSFGWHFFGNAEGPAIGGDVGVAVAGGAVVIDVAPRFTWDIRILKGMALYVSPTVAVGFSHAEPVGVAWAGWNAFYMNVAVEGKLILLDRWLVFFRPAGLDFYASTWGTAGRLTVYAGGGVTF